MKRTITQILSITICLFICSFHAEKLFAIEPPITSLTFSPDGKKVLATSQAGIQIYSWPDLKLNRTLKISSANVHCLQFSPDEKLFAVGGGNPSENGIVEVFSWPKGELLSKLTEHTDSVRSLVWQDSNKLLSASIDREIKLWNIHKNNKSLFTFKGHSRCVTSLCILPDKKTLVSAGDDQTVRVWNLEERTMIRNLNQHTKPINALSLKPSKSGLPMVATASTDRTIRIWQPSIGRMVRYVRLPVEPLSVSWLNDGLHLVAACDDGHVRVINADEVKITEDLPAIKHWAYAIAVHPIDNIILVGGANSELKKIIPQINQTPTQ